MLVLPTTRLRATPIGALATEIEGATVPVWTSLLALTLPFNLTGWPAVSVPGRVPDGGLPAGCRWSASGVEERGVLRSPGCWPAIDRRGTHRRAGGRCA